MCGGYVQKLQWQDERQQTCSSETGKSGVALPMANKATVKMAAFAFIQEDGRKTRNRKRRCMPVQNILREAPVEPPLPTADAELRQERGCSVTEINLVPVLYSRQPGYFQFHLSTLEQLSFFTWRFSPVTLTYDIKANPWQACLPQIEHAPFLLDAVRALAIRHRSHLDETRESLSVLELKDKALSSFAQSIGTVPLEVGISASLILIGIDYAESALGKWIVHLQGVYRMIEASGGIEIGGGDMHTRAQIAQLVWYDTIIALLSRRGTVFPREYVEYVVSWKTESQWSLFALNGFPDSAFLDMYDIVNAAVCASLLSDEEVSGIEMKLWLAHFEIEQGTNDTEISALTECWRLGLLLYYTRVFQRGESVKRKAFLLAEEIMWLVYELPPNSDKQKQALLPLFLAACEMESFRFRRIALDFCERWKQRSGLWLNQTAIDLLQTVWAAIDENPEKDIWWGDLVSPLQDCGYLFG
jgi:hypothetical protein